jgi:ERF superfamily
MEGARELEQPGEQEILPPEENGTTALVAYKPAPLTIVSTKTINLIDTITSMLSKETLDIEKLRVAMDISKEMMAMQAERSFNEAFAAMMPHLPIVYKRGKITANEEDDKGQKTKNKFVRSKYALFPDIIAAVTPILRAYGFGLSHSFTNDLKLKIVKGITTLRHVDGHKVTTEMELPEDSSGRKNPVQAIGSSRQYVMRYNTIALLCLASTDDDDGQAAGEPVPGADKPPVEKKQEPAPMINAVQVAELRKLLDDNPERVAKFSEKHLNGGPLENIYVRYFDQCRTLIQEANAKRAEVAAKRNAPVPGADEFPPDVAQRQQAQARQAAADQENRRQPDPADAVKKLREGQSFAEATHADPEAVFSDDDTWLHKVDVAFKNATKLTDIKHVKETLVSPCRKLTSDEAWEQAKKYEDAAFSRIQSTRNRPQR